MATTDGCQRRTKRIMIAERVRKKSETFWMVIKLGSMKSPEPNIESLPLCKDGANICTEESRKGKMFRNKNQSCVLASAPYTHKDTEFGLVPCCDSSNRFGALVWQPQPSFSISDRSCLMPEKSRQNASRIARQKKTKTGCKRHGERESERREDRGTKRGRTRKIIRCY